MARSLSHYRIDDELVRLTFAALCSAEGVVDEFFRAGWGAEPLQARGVFVGVGYDLEEIVEGLEVSLLDGGGDHGFD